MTRIPTSQPQCRFDAAPGEVAIIVAVARHGAIGRNGSLAFHIPADLKRFKALTTGHTVVMGRKTFESLPKGALPDRRNIVVTRNRSYSAPGIETAGSLAEALGMARWADGMPFIIGGGEIYRQAMAIAGRLYVTEIDAEAAGADTFFPAIDAGEWEQAEESEWLSHESPQGGAALRYRFVTYRRR